MTCSRPLKWASRARTPYLLVHLSFSLSLSAVFTVYNIIFIYIYSILSTMEHTEPYCDVVSYYIKL